MKKELVLLLMMTLGAVCRKRPFNLNEGQTKPISFRFPGGSYSSPKTYNFQTTNGNSLILRCSLIDLGKDFADACDAYLMVKDGNGETEKVCDSMEHYYYRTDLLSLEVKMKGTWTSLVTGKCKVEARKTSEVGPDLVPPNEYFIDDSEEIDSSEHGGPRGKKTTDCQCGWANKLSKRIVGGRETGVNEFPFMVALLSTDYKEQFCGGAILSPSFVLTAAHCTKYFANNPEGIAIVAGAHNIQSDDDTGVRQVISVKMIHQHDKFYKLSRVLVNDISLLELEKPLKFSKFVGPICVSTMKLNLLGQYVRNIGWGRVGHNRNSSSVLKKVDLRVIPLEVCRNKTNLAHPTEEFQICSYGRAKSSCSGDSGSPTLWLDPETNRYTVVGVVSTGEICGMYRPNVDTDVTSYYHWMKDIIQNVTPSEKMCSKIG